MFYLILTSYIRNMRANCTNIFNKKIKRLIPGVFLNKYFFCYFLLKKELLQKCNYFVPLFTMITLL